MNNDLFAPQAGAIVRCWFPEVESVCTLGSKFRPALILQAFRHEDGRIDLLVAYGTGQFGHGVGRGDMLIQKQPGIALSKDTKIRLARTVWLPMNAQWFTRDGKPEVLGHLPKSLYGEFRRAAMEVGLA